MPVIKNRTHTSSGLMGCKNPRGKTTFKLCSRRCRNVFGVGTIVVA